MADVKAAQVRKHYWLDRYVVIAPSRTHSLHHRDYPKRGTLKHPPLEKELGVYETTGAGGQWTTKVIRNLYSAFSEENPDAFGIQEVILDTNPPEVPFGALSVEQITTILKTYGQRLNELGIREGINYVSIFHNSGLEGGASIVQTHSQVIAVGLVPPQIQAEAERISQLFNTYGESPLGKVLAWEEDRKERIIVAGSQAVALSPYASWYPYEVWLVPRRPVRSLTELKEPELMALASYLKQTTAALEHEGMSYNFCLQEPVAGYGNHFYIRLCPRLKTDGGFEINTGIEINPVSPEAATTWYRSYIKKR